MSNPRPVHGRIVWHDLMTTDAKASLAFFTELIGWKTKDVDMGPMGNYTIFSAAGKDVGGLMPLDKSHGAPSHFITYFHVENLDKTLETAKRLGGNVAVPPTPIPGVGTFAVLIDPQGGVTSPMTLSDVPPEDADIPKQGMFCWEELMSTDPEASVKFYKEVYGFGSEAVDMGPMGTYTLLKRGDMNLCGIMKQPPDAPQMTHWLSYIAADDVDATTERAEKLGGQVFVKPMDIPNIGRFSVIQDPAGTVFALFNGMEHINAKQQAAG